MVDLIPLLDPKNSYFTRKFTLMSTEFNNDIDEGIEIDEYDE